MKKLVFGLIETDIKCDIKCSRNCKQVEGGRPYFYKSIIYNTIFNVRVKSNYC